MFNPRTLLIVLVVLACLAVISLHPQQPPALAHAPLTPMDFKMDSTLVSDDSARESAVLSPPLAVELASFIAYRHSTRLFFEWGTNSELNNLGFNLYGSTRSDEPMHRLTGVLVPSVSPGSSQGARYHWNVDPPMTYTYFWLEAIDAEGNRARYGPIRAERRLWLPLVGR